MYKFNPEETTWETEKEYNIGDTVKVCKVWYVCMEKHKSNVFGNDLFNERRWVRLK